MTQFSFETFLSMSIANFAIDIVIVSKFCDKDALSIQKNKPTIDEKIAVNIDSGMVKLFILIL